MKRSSEEKMKMEVMGTYACPMHQNEVSTKDRKYSI